ncbi:MAG: hypothetical protein AB7V55_01420 [Oscillospiraceae bacterium]
MDNERSGVPSGIAPKLPEPPPAAAKKGLTRRENLIVAVACVLLAALATWFIVFALGADRTAAEAVNRQAGSVYAVQQEIVQVSLPGDGRRSVLFYISGEELACALLERGASGYRLVNATGHLPLTSSDKEGIWMASGMTSDKKEFLVFGLLYDDALTAVEVDGMPATVVDNGMYRCWYYYGDSVTINSESVVYK